MKQFRIHLRNVVLTALAVMLTAPLAAQYTNSIEVLKGEQWWGVFVASDQMMPLEKPFPQTDLATWVQSNVTPFLISSRGRYIWSASTFKIEYTGDRFLIDSPTEKVEAVTGGKSLREAYLVCCHKNFPPTEHAQSPASEFFTAPVYDMRAAYPFGVTADQIRSYVDEILGAGYPAGTVIIPSGWHSTIGSFTPSTELYGNFGALMNELHGKGFRIMLTVTPFVSGDGPIYRALRKSNAFVKYTDGRTAMAEWAGGYSAFYDLTQPSVYNQISKQLKLLHDSLGVDGYWFECREALSYARYASAGTSEYLKKWSQLGADYPLSQYTISRGGGLTPYIHDLQMDRTLDWDFLSEAISNLLTANLLGFPYSSISADFGHKSDSASQNPKLLLRYVQLASVLPVMTIGRLPWHSGDQTVTAQCKQAIDGRTRIGAYYAELAQECAKTAEPIVRHMEYEFPRNGFTDCHDQFMIGSRYMVAPLLGESDTRTVRFPKGTWTSFGGQHFKGPIVAEVTAAPGEVLIFEMSK